MNGLKWHHHALERVRISYVHRGAPDDERTVSGADVVDLGPSFMELRSDDAMPAMVPYHRVLRIVLDGAMVWERRSNSTDSPA